MNTYGNQRDDLGDNGMATLDVPSEGEGRPPLPSTTFAELVDRFCDDQMELRARLALLTGVTTPLGTTECAILGHTGGFPDGCNGEGDHCRTACFI